MTRSTTRTREKSQRRVCRRGGFTRSDGGVVVAAQLRSGSRPAARQTADLDGHGGCQRRGAMRHALSICLLTQACLSPEFPGSDRAVAFVETGDLSRSKGPFSSVLPVAV